MSGIMNNAKHVRVTLQCICHALSVQRRQEKKTTELTSGQNLHNLNTRFSLECAIVIYKS